MMADRADSWWTLLAGGQIPLWLKLVYTLFVCVLVPVYWIQYGPRNFLWFSDIALFTTVLALWLENRLLASMMAVAVVLPELAWNLDFFLRLLTGWQAFGLSAYMFESHRPLYLRGLSLFHVFLPFLLLWIVYRLGYDPRAWAALTLLSLIVFPLSYLVASPEHNINWVLGPGTKPQTWLPPLLYLGLVMLVFPLFVYLPTHLALLKLFGR